MKKIIPVLFALMLGGCFALERINATNGLTLEVYNASGREIHETHVRFGEYVCLWGVVSVGATKGHSYFEKPITDTAEVKWKDSRGSHAKTVSMSGFRAAGRPNLIRYNIGEDRVEVTYANEK